jgi:type IV pilus assembly protein PilE
MRRRQQGVTLIELLTVIVVLGILAAIAVPSYRNYLMRANRSDAKSALMQLQAAQEKFYLQNNAYSGLVDTAPPTGLGLSKVTANGYYSLSITLAADGQSYTAKADPTTAGGQNSDKSCASFTLTDTGTRNVSGTMGAAQCWK